MALMIRYDRDGKPRKTWYGRISVKGAVRDVNLNVPIEGVPPVDEGGRVSLALRGDAAFERSRRAAQRAHDAWRHETQTDPAELAQKAYKARTGVSLDAVPLAKLFEKWKSQKRGYVPTNGWATATETWFSRFAAFARTYAQTHGGKRCETINDVTPEIAAAWFDEIKATHAWETVTKMMSLMRGAYRRYATNGRANPFEDIVMRNREASNARVPHKPLTAGEVERLFKYARDDADIYPLAVCAACTGMRIGDVCHLKWEDVDLQGGFIDVTTAKAGMRATIPIFGRLGEVLAERSALAADGGKASPYVFPKAAARYDANSCGIYVAIKPYIARAVFGDAPEPENVAVDADGTANAEPHALEDVIDGAGFAEKKRARMLKVYERIKAGAMSRDVASELGITRSQVSMDLAEIERLTGETLRPRNGRTKARADRMKQIDRTRAKREIGKHAASLYGWHSLRATFVVLAVEAGVPLPDVQKVVGHSTAEMTLQYFNPEKKHAAERVRAQMRGSVLDCGRDGGRTMIAASPSATSGAVAAAGDAPRSVDDVIASMTDAQRRELMRKLAASL